MLDDSAECVLIERDRTRPITHPELWLDLGSRFPHAQSMRVVTFAVTSRCLMRLSYPAHDAG
jgi:hypothetical protein